MDSNDDRTGFVGAIRQKAIGFPDLTNMERHGKREDASGQKRRVRDADPLVYGSLNLREARKAHMQGVMQSGQSACIHALVQFPNGLLDGNSSVHQADMLSHAVHFLNTFHGGDAVFAARLDRDERGLHTVDVFLLPRYDFHYKDGRCVKKGSVSKFAKAEAKKRFGRDDRRSQGSALQDAFFEHLRDSMQLDGVLPPQRKKATTKDRVEPESYALQKERVALRTHAQKISAANQRVQKQNIDQAAINKAEAQRIAEQVASLTEAQSRLTEARSAAEKYYASQTAALDQKAANIRRDAKTVRNVRIASGQGISRSLNRVIDQIFESQDVR